MVFGGRFLEQDGEEAVQEEGIVGADVVCGSGRSSGWIWRIGLVEEGEVPAAERAVECSICNASAGEAAVGCSAAVGVGTVYFEMRDLHTTGETATRGLCHSIAEVFLADRLIFAYISCRHNSEGIFGLVCRVQAC